MTTTERLELLTSQETAAQPSTLPHARKVAMTADEAIQAIRTATCMMTETSLALTTEEATDVLERAHADTTEALMETSRRLGMGMARKPGWIDDDLPKPNLAEPLNTLERAE